MESGFYVMVAQNFVKLVSIVYIDMLITIPRYSDDVTTCDFY